MQSSNDQNAKTDRHTVAQPPPREDDTFKPRLIVVSGVMLGFQLELGSALVVVGRASECGLSLPHPSVSRHHCRIWREGDTYIIEDLGSTNRTYLNGKPITRAELRDGDQIAVGSNAIKYFTGASMEATYHNELIDLAIYDGLTGFYNRRHFRGILDEYIEKVRPAAPVGLLIMDLDHFKRVNDTHGHLCGDQVLTRAAQIIRENAPAGAPIGRLGGEEFALALRNTSLHDAVQLAERIRAAVAAQAFETREATLPITISIGAAQCLGQPATSADLLRRADEQLYRAKDEGRNRVCADES
ncbi:MAG TPA: GGDEF domain-containing protein [Rudaea sp.]|nr:GGDEF domain-containing protein [Rudaea sp.]